VSLVSEKLKLTLAARHKLPVDVATDIILDAKARKAGIVVVLCTGRALIECKTVIKAIDQTDPVIVSGG
jgi:hydroxymethylpyrimidine pyrophosphatase-like HAD family hydrolase